MAMSLETSEKMRNLQRKLHRKAKAEPAFRFYLLYDNIRREDILRHAYARPARMGRARRGRSDLQADRRVGCRSSTGGYARGTRPMTYRPDPVRRATIPRRWW